jgi:hypothetical protein
MSKLNIEIMYRIRNIENSKMFRFFSRKRGYIRAKNIQQNPNSPKVARKFKY